jgi:hypothetical protein
LDWRLIKENISTEDLEEGVKIPDGLQEYDATENIAFLENLNKNCFCPVFIFTNEDVSSIKNKLIEQKLIIDDKPSNLFLQPKSELQEDKALFSKVTTWIEQTPSVYVLKEWEKEYQNCRTKLFLEFYALSPFWPTIMWENFGDDGANKSLEMGELISRNLHSRMTPFEFDDGILNKASTVPKDELRKVLEGERYLKKYCIHENEIGTGDLFREEYNDKGQTKIRYFLNIRAQCDLLRADYPQLYLISGYVLTQKENGKIDNISFNQGQYLENPTHSVIAFVDNGNIIEFKFSEFEIKSWDDIKDKRVGRLLPPYINRVQQRYALYMQRQGLPRIPNKAIFDR